MVNGNTGGYYDFTTADANTTSLTLIDVPQMFFPLNVIGQVWAFEFTLIIGSSTTTGLKVALSVPPGASFRAWATGSGAAKSTLLLDLMNTSGTLTAAFNTFVGQQNYLSVRGAIVNGSFAGNVQLQAAKVTSGTATLSAGSYFTANPL